MEYMKQRRRSKVEIIYSILKATENESLLTKIMYQSYMCWKPFIEIVENLKAGGLVTEIKGGPDRRSHRGIELTPNGATLLRELESSTTQVNRVLNITAGGLLIAFSMDKLAP
jgi:predicted transcriptional regulator